MILCNSLSLFLKIRREYLLAQSSCVSPCDIDKAILDNPVK